MPNVKAFQRILLFIPNIIGYIRLLLLSIAYFNFDIPNTFIALYIGSMTLDFFDGLAARKLNQCSSFGAWFDVVIDNISRGMLWANLFKWGWLIVSLEWITFIGNHSSGGSKWKELNLTQEKPPFFVQKVMENGFKTMTGIFAISGLHLLPLWFYVINYFHLHFIIILIGSSALISGRLLSAACELWCIKQHIRLLLLEDLMDESNHNVKKN